MLPGGVTLAGLPDLPVLQGFALRAFAAYRGASAVIGLPGGKIALVARRSMASDGRPFLTFPDMAAAVRASIPFAPSPGPPAERSRSSPPLIRVTAT